MSDQPTSDFTRLAAEAGGCVKCALSETRTQVVFGTGNPDADLVFVGEAPGRDEDLKGEPFVGRAGKLLDKLLSEIGIERSDVYIANILKCRPPANRDPQPAEIEACTPYLDRQIELIKPVIIATLGNFATKYLLDTKVGITRLRGKRFKYPGAAALIPTFHPAAALRGGEKVLVDMRADFSVMQHSIETARARDEQAVVSGAAASAPQPDVMAWTSSQASIKAEPDDDSQLELF